MSVERNMETLTALYKNMGPGIEHWMEANRTALDEDCTWYMQGWPHVIGMREIENQIRVFNVLLGVEQNPILDWRVMTGSGDRVFFERRGSFADKDGQTIVSWDIFGVYFFNEVGKVTRVRDYFDSSEPLAKLRGIVPPEKMALIGELARHPLDPNYVPHPTFWTDMLHEITG
jgi:limonene-1,2-epoxide hydrolase